MLISGIKTSVERVEVNVDPIAVLGEINLIIRRHMGIEDGWYLGKAYKTDKYVLKEDTDNYHGSPTISTVDENPSQEVIDYLLLQEKYYTHLRNAVRKLDTKTKEM